MKARVRFSQICIDQETDDRFSRLWALDTQGRIWTAGRNFDHPEQLEWKLRNVPEEETDTQKLEINS